MRAAGRRSSGGFLFCPVCIKGWKCDLSERTGGTCVFTLASGVCCGCGSDNAATVPGEAMVQRGAEASLQKGLGVGCVEKGCCRIDLCVLQQQLLHWFFANLR